MMHFLQDHLVLSCGAQSGIDCVMHDWQGVRVVAMFNISTPCNDLSNPLSWRRLLGGIGNLGKRQL